MSSYIIIALVIVGLLLIMRKGYPISDLEKERVDMSMYHDLWDYAKSLNDVVTFTVLGTVSHNGRYCLFTCATSDGHIVSEVFIAPSHG